MSEFTDEILMAYADGELSGAELRRVELYLDNDPVAPQRLSAFTQTGRDLALLFDQPMREPIPARLLETVLGSGARSATLPSRPAFVTALIDALFPAQGQGMWQSAVAATALLAVGGVAGWSLSGAQVGNSDTASLARLVDGAVVANGDLSRVLDTTASGTAASLGAQSPQLTMKPVLTFQSVAGAYCRQYELAQSTGARFSGVSCRAENGQWHIEVHSPIGGKPSSAQGGIAPANRQSLPAVEGAIDKMINGDALGREAERALIENRWRRAP